jgi:signal transduction histidine kinase
VAFNGEPPISLFRGVLWSSPVTNPVAFQGPVDLRSLEVRFTALNYASPGDMRFRHQLEGWDGGWVDDGASRRAVYSYLPHGHYRFRVAARSANGPWHMAPETFEFVVPTPVYLQKWAVSLYILAAVALVAGVVRIVSHRRLRNALARLEQQQALERERMRIARDMHDEMGSKLTKISFLSEHAQVDPAVGGTLAGKIQAIARTSRELLQTMDEIVWVVNPRNDTLENLVAYLTHYAVEYFQNTRVQCELRLPPDIPHHPLSSEVRHNLFLTFEEALNNVLKHSAASKVKVEMRVALPKFEIRITDNGRGFAPASLPPPESLPRAKRGGNGLRNMRQRLAEAGGACEIASEPGTGTVVTLRIHLK